MGAVVLRLTVYLGGLALVIALAIRVFPVLPGLALAPSADPQWVAIERPHAAFAVTFPDIPDPHPLYRVMRAATGGGRKDVMTLEAQGRSALVEVYRPGKEGRRADLAALLATEAAALGQVEQATPAPAIDSRFGPVTLLDFTLTTGERRRGCLAFQRTLDDPAFQISGWLCNPGDGLVARPTVACGLDKLTLLSAGSDPKLAQFFARAELAGSFCTQKRARGQLGRAPDWIDARETRWSSRLRGTAKR
jgi:hypothetical protein